MLVSSVTVEEIYYGLGCFSRSGGCFSRSDGEPRNKCLSIGSGCLPVSHLCASCPVGSVTLSPPHLQSIPYRFSPRAYLGTVYSLAPTVRSDAFPKSPRIPEALTR